MGRIDQQSICGYYDDALIILIYYYERRGIFLTHIMVIMCWLFGFMILVGKDLFEQYNLKIVHSPVDTKERF